MKKSAAPRPRPALDRTISEVLFEDLCTDLGIEYKPVACEIGKRTHDYDIYPQGKQIVVEVKQFDLNEEDRTQLPERKGGGCFIQSPIESNRIRNKITNAAPQLKGTITEGHPPAMLVIYNNVPALRYDEPYEVKIAMYGTEVVTLLVPQESPRTRGITILDQNFGPRRKMTPDDNTSISAVAVLFRRGGRIGLDVYHNVHARRPLNPTLLTGENVCHYTLESKKKGKFQEWEEIHQRAGGAFSMTVLSHRSVF